MKLFAFASAMILVTAIGLGVASNQMTINQHRREIAVLTRARDRAADAKATLCAGARTQAAIALYALRSPTECAVGQAHGLSNLMSYCDGDRGAALAREIEDTILSGIPRERGDTPPPIDIERIRAALLAFSEGR